jgi:hypothetical protein
VRPRTRDVLVVAFLWCLFTPSIGSAQIGRGWLERLSGPGPFRGWPVVELHPICISAPDDDPKEVARVLDANRDSPDYREASRFVRPLGGRTWLSPLNCHFLDRDEHRIEIGFQFSPLHSGANPLDYSERPEDADTRINLRMYVFTGDIRVNRVLDVGAGLGFGRFSSRGDLFDSFTRLVGQPMRLTTRPLAILVNSRKWGEAVLLQFDGTRFSGGFTAADFGARPGTFDDPGEMLWTWSAKVDLTAFIW